MLRRCILTTLVLGLLGLSILWAALTISIVAYDSYGNFRSPGILGVPMLLLLSLSPACGCLWVLYRTWFRPRPLEGS